MKKPAQTPQKNKPSIALLESLITESHLIDDHEDLMLSDREKKQFSSKPSKRR